MEIHFDEIIISDSFSRKVIWQKIQIAEKSNCWISFGRQYHQGTTIFLRQNSQVQVSNNTVCCSTCNDQLTVGRMCDGSPTALSGREITVFVVTDGLHCTAAYFLPWIFCYLRDIAVQLLLEDTFGQMKFSDDIFGKLHSDKWIQRFKYSAIRLFEFRRNVMLPFWMSFASSWCT